MLLERITNDQSYLVIATSLNEIGKLNPSLAVSVAKKLEGERSEEIKLTIGQIYGGHGNAECQSFFKKTIESGSIKGYDQIAFLNSFSLFNTAQDIEINEQSFPILEYLSKNGDSYMTMFLPKFITYFQKMCAEKIFSLKEEVEVNEKNKDAAYANQNRIKIKRFESLIVQFSSLQVTKNNSH